MRNHVLLPIIGAATFGFGSMLAHAEEEAGPLGGFVRTGETQNCLSLVAINQIKPLTDELFLVRVGVSKYYLNEVSGSCNGATSSFNRLQYKVSTSSLCRNEIIRIVDNSQGFTVGSCGLGSFERLEAKPADASKDG